jgi:hypothetical protein
VSSIDSFFLGLNQYMFPPEVDLFSLGMLPTIAAIEAYCNYGELTENTFQLYIVMDSTPTGLPTSQSMHAIEGMQPVADLSFLIGDGCPLRENPTTKILENAGDEVKCSSIS